MNASFLMISSLQMENRALRKKLEAHQKGEAIQNLRAEYRSVIAEKDREIKRVMAENADLREGNHKIRDLWMDTCEDIWAENQKIIAKQSKKIEQLNDRIWEVIRNGDDRVKEVTECYEKQLSEKDKVIEDLENQVAHLKAVLGHDGTNTNLPTAQTPPGKTKVIPNTREKTGRKKGGQPGHARHMLKPPCEEDVNDSVVHEVEDEICPNCHSDQRIRLEKKESRYEYDLEIKVIRRRHDYYFYRCLDCGQEYVAALDPNLRAECQYGSGVKAMALSLTGTVNAAINKVPLFLSGITDGEIKPSEGYISNLQKKAYKGLKQFSEDLYRHLIQLKDLHWDDTVIMMETKRACLRFYGDEKIAYFTAHAEKGMEGLDEDNVLNVLSPETRVMHDHNKVSYNKKYRFKNLECNAHLQRDIQKAADDTGHPEWLELKKLISETIKKRNLKKEEGETSFRKEEIQNFRTSVEDILERARKTNAKDQNRYYTHDEEVLIKRIEEYYENYFSWLTDFTISVTNNVSERALRGVKSHMKVSGQFESVEAARYYARIRSYLETCRRNGVNEIDALSRLADGNPYTVEEILSYTK